MKQNSQINIVDEIKSRCDIVDVVGRVVSLKRREVNYKEFACSTTKKHLLLLYPKQNRYIHASDAELQAM